MSRTADKTEMGPATPAPVAIIRDPTLACLLHSREDRVAEKTLRSVAHADINGQHHKNPLEPNDQECIWMYTVLR